MATAIPILPESQARALAAAYDGAIAAKRARLLAGLGVLAACVVLSAWVAEVDIGKFAANIDRFTSYIGRLFFLDTGRPVWSDLPEWFWGLPKWWSKLLETMLIAYIGTLAGFAGGFLLCFSASANLARSAWGLFLARRSLEFCRTVPEIVFALIFVVSFGLGPLPGVLAIAIHTMGALGKLFSEVVENADMKPFEGLTAAGGAWVAAIRYAILPQVSSNFASYALLRFEINVRGAAVMGFVGAGGIGQDLIEAIRKFYYSDVSALLAIIIASVMVIDLVTEQVRHRLIGEGQGR